MADSDRDTPSEKEADEESSSGETQPWLWGAVLVAVVVLVVAAWRCGSDDGATVGDQPGPALTGATASGPPGATGEAPRGAAPIVANQEASSPKYRMKFSLGPQAPSRPSAAPTTGSTATPTVDHTASAAP